MEILIKEALTDEVFEQAISLYDISKEDIKFLGGFENLVYEYVSLDKSYILRFVHSSHRETKQVEAEIEWIEFLFQNNASVSRVVQSKNQRHLEVIECSNQAYFVVTAFERAKGTYVKHTDINDDFNYKFGKSVGKLHDLTKSYKPHSKRIQWHEETIIRDFGEKYLPKNEMIVLDKYEKLVEKIKKLPVNRDSYGLIHTDLHFGNMYYDGNDLTFFDFDDSAYFYFISDIAIIIFYQFGLSDYTDQQKEEMTYKFLKYFCKGYLEETNLDYSWFEHINDFLKLRELVLYIVLHSTGEEGLNSKWAQNYIRIYKERILNDIPFFDYKKAIGLL